MPVTAMHAQVDFRLPPEITPSTRQSSFLALGPLLGCQGRLSACEVRRRTTLRIEYEGTKLGDSGTDSTPLRKPRAAAYPAGPPAAKGSSPPGLDSTGLRYSGPQAPGLLPASPSLCPSHLRATPPPSPPSPPPHEKLRTSAAASEPRRSSCFRRARRVTDNSGPPLARWTLPLVGVGAGGAVIGPARTNEVVGWRGAEAGAGEHLRMGGTSSFRAALESGLAWLGGAKTWVPRVAGTGPAAPWRGPSSRGGGGGEPSATGVPSLAWHDVGPWAVR